MFGADIVTAIPELRAHAESLMLDYGTAKRPTGQVEYVGGVDIDAYADLFSSPCKIQVRTIQGRESEVGGRTSVASVTELHLPANTTPLQVGDVWELTAVDPISLAKVGQRVRILAPAEGTLKTASRYPVEEVLT